jgi:hypothetical protein
MTEHTTTEAPAIAVEWTVLTRFFVADLAGAPGAGADEPGRRSRRPEICTRRSAPGFRCRASRSACSPRR